MKFETTFLRSKVAIRIFVLFICCALLPVSALTILSFSHVTKQLSEQTQKRLHEASKDVGRAIAERIYFLEGELKEVAYRLSMESNPIFSMPPKEFNEQLKKRFKAIVLIADTGEPMHLFGQIQNIPALIPEQKQHIQSGRSLLFSEHHPGLSSRILMSTAIDPEHPKRGILLGEIDTTYLWGETIELPLPPMTELCLLDESNHVLFSSVPGQVSFPDQVVLKMTRSSMGMFEWVHEKNEYMASYRSIFLQPVFFTRQWTVVLSESKSDVLTPMANFKKIFPLVILMSLLVVIFLSVIQIRRSLIPLRKLQEGTSQIAKSDFDSRVTIESGDEFEDLAASFNTMASRLGKQFKTLTTMSEIDRAILSTLDTRKIVNTLLTRMPEVFPCDGIAITLIGPNASDVGQIYFKETKPGSKIQVETIQLPPKLLEKLHVHQESFFLTDEENPDYLSPLVKLGIKLFLVLPVFIKERLAASIRLGYFTPPALIQDDLDQTRQLADQMAVALSNASLIEELNQLNLGTLTALARAIDAKSPWTAGHSERVTKLALEIGKVLGLRPKELDVLHRGGLLHDTGKVGTPAIILDKPGKLTDEETKSMREHVHIGARILEPIAAYAEVMPIVLQHHEWFDGKGYPYGISGEAIHLYARIFAVADYFDAVTSDRPYRPGMDRKRVIESIKQEAGHQFDPKVVQAFLEVMAQEDREGETS